MKKEQNFHKPALMPFQILRQSDRPAN
uniref:Uncharacterized protein n=1 Tax=Arundo donax TaxID=35708 RepID=A0A0A9C7I6_ARUDO